MKHRYMTLLLSLSLMALVLSGCTFFTKEPVDFPVFTGELVVSVEIPSEFRDGAAYESVGITDLILNLKKDHRVITRERPFPDDDDVVTFAVHDLVRGSWDVVATATDLEGTVFLTGASQADITADRTNEVRISLDVVEDNLPERLLSLGASYTNEGSEYHDSHNDIDANKLTDGEDGSATWWQAPSTWVGVKLVANQSVHQFILDLTESYPITTVGVHLLNADDAGILLPREVRASVSEDGVNWSAPASVEVTPVAGGSLQRADVSLDGKTGRFVKVQIDPTGEWTFIGEIAVYGRPL